MASYVFSALVCAVCVILLPAVLAEYCNSFVDANGYYHDKQSCRNRYCCGTCSEMYCCDDRSYRITEEEQLYCSGSSSNSDKRGKLSTLLGSILGSVLPILLCVGLVICCVAPCCLCYKKCRKGHNGSTRHTPVVIHPTPHGPSSPSRIPGYSPVPAQLGFGGLPNPAPPPYNPGVPSFAPGQPMYPLVPPSQPGGFSQPPYNPSYPMN